MAGHTFFLASLHVLPSLLRLGLLIEATATLNKVLRRPLAVKGLDRLTGCVFFAFGLRLAASSGR